MSQIGDQQIVNFTVGEVSYGVPVDQVREVREIQAVVPIPGAPSYIEGMSNLRGQLITVMDLKERLNLAAAETTGDKIIVIEVNDLSVGVVVDTVTDVSTITEDNIEANMEFASEYDEYVIGVGKQEGNLVVILNLANVITDISDQINIEKTSTTSDEK